MDNPDQQEKINKVTSEAGAPKGFDLTIQGEGGDVASVSWLSPETGLLVFAKLGHRELWVNYDSHGKIEGLDFTPEFEPISTYPRRSYLGRSTARLINPRNATEMVERIKSKKHTISKRRDSLYHLDFDDQRQVIVIKRFDQGKHSDTFEVPVAVLSTHEVAAELAASPEFAAPEALLEYFGIKWQRF